MPLFFFLSCKRHSLSHIVINAVHIFYLDQACLFQRFYHTVNGSHADTWVTFCCFIINLLAAAALILQDHIDQKLSLAGNPTAILF